MTDGRVFPQEAAASMLAMRGYTVDAPAHMGWEQPLAGHFPEPSALDKQAFNLLVNSGWGVTPPVPAVVLEDALAPKTDAEAAAIEALVSRGYQVIPPYPGAWVPAFKPQFHEADAEGNIYARIDLPEGLYYAFQDAARAGLVGLKARRETFEKVERQVCEVENGGPPIMKRSVGVLDGIDLSSMEIRGMIRMLDDQIKRWEQALERADTRNHR